MSDSSKPGYLSYSQYTTYSTCPWQWYLTRVEKVPEDPAWWFLGGTAVHSAADAVDHAILKEAK